MNVCHSDLSGRNTFESFAILRTCFPSDACFIQNPDGRFEKAFGFEAISVIPFSLRRLKEIDREAARFLCNEERVTSLSGLCDQLEALPGLWILRSFVLICTKALAYTDGNKSYRPPFDLVLTFKTLVTQLLNNLPDEQTEYLINDRPLEI